LLFSILQSLEASQPHTTLSFQGYTGLINTPNAQVMSEGDITMHFDNHFSNHLRKYNYELKRKNNTSQSYIFGAGIFPYLEIQGRLAEVPGYYRDLSANIKLQVPYKHKYLPNIAFGYQDPGSAYQAFGNRYVVLDKKVSFIRASVGYGQAEGREKRMDGFFGGVEVEPVEWLSILAENDAKENFAALRLRLPKSWSESFKLDATLATNLTNENALSFGVNLTFPLYENTKEYHQDTINSYAQEIRAERKEKKEITSIPRLENLKTAQNHENVNKVTIDLEELKTMLQKIGFENITLGENQETLYVSYEDNQYLHNQLDGLGIVLGFSTLTKYSHFIIEPKRSDIILYSLQGSLKDTRLFYNSPTPENKRIFTASLSKSSPRNLDNFTFSFTNKNSTRYKPIVEIKPILQTFVGTDFGAFNYMLWLRSKLQVNLYSGIDITAVGDIHINNSEIENKQKFEWFTKLYERDSHMESIMIHGSYNLFGGINTLSLGTFEENFSGVINQYIYNYSNHTLAIKAGYFKQFQNGDPYKRQYFGVIPRRKVFLLNYNYLVSDYDTQLELEAGQYWNQDRGYSLSVKRFFTDVALIAKYEESTPYFSNSVNSETKNRYISLGVEIPLTLTKTPTYKYAQLRGTNAFNYRVKTTVARKDGSNSLVPGGNYNPEVSLESKNYFYNRNRAQLSYIQKHAFRLVDSFMKNKE